MEENSNNNVLNKRVLTPSDLISIVVSDSMEVSTDGPNGWKILTVLEMPMLTICILLLIGIIYSKIKKKKISKILKISFIISIIILIVSSISLIYFGKLDLTL